MGASPDDLIADYLEAKPGSEDALRTSGPETLRRMFSLWSGTAGSPLERGPARGSGVAASDRWTHALSILATAHPDEFLPLASELLASGRGEDHLTTTLVSILGDIDDDRALTMLREALRESDKYHVRYNALRSVRGGHLHRPEARQLVEQLTSDPDWAIRIDAITGLGEWAPERALALMQAELVTTSELTPLMTQQAQMVIGRCRAAAGMIDAVELAFGKLDHPIAVQVRDRYLAVFDRTSDPDVAVEAVLAELEATADDADGGPIFWTALALQQLALGHLRPAVRSVATDMINRALISHRWAGKKMLDSRAAMCWELWGSIEQAGDPRTGGPAPPILRG